MEKDTSSRTGGGREMGGSFTTPDLETQRDALGTQTDLIDTNAEESYWRQSFSTRPYVPEGTPFIEYRPAYRFGADAYSKYPGRTFEHAEPELMQQWDSFKGTSSLTWDNARHAVRDAWERVSDFIERVIPGDSDRDGK